mmetsp:Transcript_52599/g.125877  ORF Transcript_52599/g.125877 Transcript_52599/m.125877 type:complete len:219 (+) Transcript_52599:241-897(+)
MHRRRGGGQSLCAAGHRERGVPGPGAAGATGLRAEGAARDGHGGAEVAEAGAGGGPEAGAGGARHQPRGCRGEGEPPELAPGGAGAGGPGLAGGAGGAAEAPGVLGARAAASAGGLSPEGLQGEHRLLRAEGWLEEVHHGCLAQVRAEAADPHGTAPRPGYGDGTAGGPRAGRRPTRASDLSARGPGLHGVEVGTLRAVAAWREREARPEPPGHALQH